MFVCVCVDVDVRGFSNFSNSGSSSRLWLLSHNLVVMRIEECLRREK